MPFDCDALLADGSVVTIRPAAAADRDALRALHEGLSPESLYLRFFSVSRQAALEYVDRLLLPQTSDHATLVGVAGDRMLAVGNFERLDGFPVAKRYDDGVVDVIVTLDADETVLTAVDKRDQHATVRSLERVLRPRSVALIGASRKPHAVGHEVLRNLLASGFSGPIYPVNSRADRVLGVATYRSVEDIRDPIDLAVIAVPAAQAEEAVAQCGRRQVHGVVVLSAGFADTGAAGAASQQALVRLARRYGMRLIGPNCIGVVNTEPAVRLNATFAPTPPRPGPIGFLSQSGGLGIALLERATALEVGVSTFVSVGNQADVSTNDLLWWWEQDSATGVIALYVESFGNPRKFARIARRVSHSKPIVAIKGGRSAVGARAAHPHSAAAATPSAEVAALFQQAGVVAVDTLGELFGVATVLTHTRLPAGCRLAILGEDGGPNVLAADAAAGPDGDCGALTEDDEDQRDGQLGCDRVHRVRQLVRTGQRRGSDQSEHRVDAVVCRDDLQPGGERIAANRRDGVYRVVDARAGSEQLAEPVGGGWRQPGQLEIGAGGGVSGQDVRTAGVAENGEPAAGRQPSVGEDGGDAEQLAECVHGHHPGLLEQSRDFG